MFEDLLAQLTGGGGGMMDPALGSLLSSNPEAIIPHLVKQGVAPPPLPTESIPQNAQPTAGPPMDMQSWGVGATPSLEAQEQPRGITTPTPQPAAPQAARPAWDPLAALQGHMPALQRAGEIAKQGLRAAFVPGSQIPPTTPPAAAAPQTLQGATAADPDQGYK